MPLHLLLSLSLALPAQAGDCDGPALAAEATGGPPAAAARAFVQLSACDPLVARKAAKVVLPRILPGDEGYQAVVSAIRTGAPADAAAWVAGLQSDDRARAIKSLGDACAESEPVQAFFAERARSLGDEFWSQRWYRGLAACKSEPLLELMWAELKDGPKTDRPRFSAVLETWARARGALAIPALSELLKGVGDDAEAQAAVVSALGAAAGVGGDEGIKAVAAARAGEAIQSAAPGLSVKAVEQARITLLALGDEAGSDGLAAVRYKDRFNDNEKLLWGVVVDERATCRGDKPAQRLSWAPVREPGRTWPDQFKDRLQPALEAQWGFDLAASCKGTGTVEVLVPAEPFTDKASFEAWAAQTVQERLQPDVKKPVKLKREPVQM